MTQHSSPEKATAYAGRLAFALWEKHFREDAPDWKPLHGDLLGILTQIDNMTTGLSRAPAQQPASPMTADFHKAFSLLNWGALELTSDMREIWRDEVMRYLTELSALTSTNSEGCPVCMGSGYSSHPDSGEVCQACKGQGEP